MAGHTEPGLALWLGLVLLNGQATAYFLVENLHSNLLSNAQVTRVTLHHVLSGEFISEVLHLLGLRAEGVDFRANLAFLLRVASLT